MQYLIGLLFVAVGYQLLIAGFIPATTVWTLMDRYTLFMFLFTLSVMIEPAIYSRWVAAEQWENIGLDSHTLCYSAVFLGFHAYYVAIVTWHCHRNAKLIVAPRASSNEIPGQPPPDKMCLQPRPRCFDLAKCAGLPAKDLLCR